MLTVRGNAGKNGVLLSAYLAYVCLLVIAIVSWLAFRDTITSRQALGIFISLAGALVAIAHGDVNVLLGLRFNPGDLWMLAGVPVWAVYSTLLKRRPAALPQLTLLTATVIAGVGLLFPLYLWQLWHAETMAVNGPNLLGLLYIYVRFLGEEMAAQPDAEAQVQPDEDTQNLASLRWTRPKMGLEYPR